MKVRSSSAVCGEDQGTSLDQCLHNAAAKLVCFGSCCYATRCCTSMHELMSARMNVTSELRTPYAGPDASSNPGLMMPCPPQLEQLRLSGVPYFSEAALIPHPLAAHAAAALP